LHRRTAVVEKLSGGWKNNTCTSILADSARKGIEKMFLRDTIKPELT
jgi:hypothetical protein